MKKIILFVSLLSSYNLLAKTEAILKTGLEINPEFAPIYENKEKNIYGKNISHYKTGYNLRLLDLNIDIKDKGLTFGTQIKSQRNNIALNDWDGDTTETSYYKDTRVKNHDLGIKLNAKYVSPEFLGLKSTSELKYYVDNLVNLRRIDKDTNVVTDYEVPSEFIEDDGSKERLGNTIIKSALNGKFLNKVNVNADVEYKANQLVRFDKDESYIKTNIKLDGNVNDDVKIEGKYLFDYDLNLANVKFDPLTTKLEEFPDYLGGNYIDLLKNEIGLRVTSKFGEKTNFITLAKTEIDTFIQGGENKNEPTRSVYNKLTPVLAFSIESNIGKGVILKPEFNNTFDFRHTVFYPETNKQIPIYDTWLGYTPQFNFGLDYKNDNLDYKGKIGYQPTLTVLPFVTKIQNIRHTFVTENKLEGKYKLNENSNIKGSLEANIKLPIMKGAIEPITSKFNFDLEFNHKFNDKLSLKTILNNNLNLTSDKTVLNLNNFTEEFNIDGELNYKIFENAKDKLELNSKLGYKNKTQFNYYIIEDKTDSNSKKILYLNGKSVPIESLNTIKFDSKLNYENQLSSDVKLLAGVDLNTKLELLSLRKEKMYSYKNKEKDLPSNKTNLLASDDKKVNWNLGGNITITPNLRVEYKALENLFLTAGVNSKIVFEREIVNKINKPKKSLDNGSYGWVDKTFGFKKFVPSVNLNLEYKW